MSPRHIQNPTPHDHESHTGSHVGGLASQDKDRHEEAGLHHTENHSHPHAPHHPLRKEIDELNPHPPHVPQNKPVLPPRHDTHSHLHGDELPTHTNKPGPISPSKKMTKGGRKP
jgi:hypothetical protein